MALAWHLGEDTAPLVIDRSGLVILEENIRRDEQWVDALDVGLAELVFIGGWVGVATICPWETLMKTRDVEVCEQL